MRHGADLPFPPFDREAMFASSTGESLGQLLDQFAELRTDSLAQLAAMILTDDDLTRMGRHPARTNRLIPRAKIVVE